MKKCTKCGLDKDLLDYYKDNRRKNGLFSECKTCSKIQQVKYHKNSQKFKDYQRKYEREKYNNNIQFKLTVLLRSRLLRAIKIGKKQGSAVKDLGCSISEFKLYMEKKFKDGMSWNNLARFGWHIDHIIPLSKFDLTKKEEFQKAVHYTNLQPLWATENLKKGNR